VQILKINQRYLEFFLDFPSPFRWGRACPVEYVSLLHKVEVAAGSGSAPEGLMPRRESLWLGEG